MSNIYEHPSYPDYYIVHKSLIQNNDRQTPQSGGYVPQHGHTPGHGATPPTRPPQYIIQRHNYLKSLSQDQLRQLIQQQKSGHPVHLPTGRLDDLSDETEIDYYNSHNENRSLGSITLLFNCRGKWANILVGGLVGPVIPIIFSVDRVYQDFMGNTLVEGWQDDLTGNFFFIPAYPERMMQFILC